MPKLLVPKSNNSKDQLSSFAQEVSNLPETQRLEKTTAPFDGKSNALTAAAKRDPEALESMITSLPQDERLKAIETRDDTGNSALEVAVKRNPKSIEPMLKSLTKEQQQQALTNELDESRNTLLTIAAKSKKESFGKILKTISKSEDDPYVKSTGNIEEIFNRYLKEDTGVRGGEENVLDTAKPLLESMVKNPKNIDTFDQIAGEFLDGCINQPVAGITHMSAWAGVANADSVKDKIDAAKDVFILDEITSLVRSSHPEEKKSTEVEAGNVLLREVNKKLVEQDGRKPMNGIPESFDHQGDVTEWVNENLEKAYNQVKENIINQDDKAIAERLTESSHSETWAKVAFPDKMAEISKSFEEKQDILEDRGDYEALEKLSFERSEAMLSTSKQLTFDHLDGKVIPETKLDKQEQTKDTFDKDPFGSSEIDWGTKDQAKDLLKNRETREQNSKDAEKASKKESSGKQKVSGLSNAVSSTEQTIDSKGASAGKQNELKQR